MKSIASLTLVCLLCLSVLNVNAATHYLVPSNAGAANPYTSWETAGTNIVTVMNAAMTNATTPRIVLATNGIYRLTSTVTITNDVVLTSVNGRDTAVFNGQGLCRCFSLKHLGCVLDGLTISNGYDTGAGGAGAFIYFGTITNCSIVNCVVNSGADDSGGGGIRIYGTGVVANCLISRNTKTGGSGGIGGIWAAASIWGTGPCDGIIQNCIIEYNMAAAGHGGGLALANNSVARNCLIRYNATTNTGAKYGGGISTGGSNTLVINCTIVSNWANSGGGGINFYRSTTNCVINCLIASNSPEDIGGYAATKFSSCAFSRAKPSTPPNALFSLTGADNTTNDPGFVDFAAGNFTFTRTSPCYNSGTNQTGWMNGATDLDGHPRILHGTVDMGAYELFIPRGTMFKLR